MSPEAVAAVIALVGVLISCGISYLIADRKLTTERRLEIASYELIRKLLRQTDWQMRSFGAIKAHLPGFADDELRKLLVAAGALAFAGEDGMELWGLLERNEHRLKPTVYADEEPASPKPKARAKRQADRKGGADVVKRPAKGGGGGGGSGGGGGFKGFRIRGIAYKRDPNPPPGFGSGF